MIYLKFKAILSKIVKKEEHLAYQLLAMHISGPHIKMCIT